MKIRFKFFFVLCLVSPASIPSLFAADLTGQVENFYAGLTDWQASFKQTTYIPSLEQTIAKQGDIFLKKPGKLNLEYSGTDERRYVSNGKKLWVYNKGLGKIEKSGKLARELSQEAFSFLTWLGSISNFFSHDELIAEDKEVLSQTNLTLLALKPIDETSPLERLILAVNPASGRVEQILIYNFTGNRTHYVFENITTNTGLNEAFFDKPK